MGFSVAFCCNKTFNNNNNNNNNNKQRNTVGLVIVICHICLWIEVISFSDVLKLLFHDK